VISATESSTALMMAGHRPFSALPRPPWARSAPEGASSAADGAVPGAPRRRARAARPAPARWPTFPRDGKTRNLRLFRVPTTAESPDAPRRCSLTATTPPLPLAEKVDHAPIGTVHRRADVPPRRKPAPLPAPPALRISPPKTRAISTALTDVLGHLELLRDAPHAAAWHSCSATMPGLHPAARNATSRLDAAAPARKPYQRRNPQQLRRPRRSDFGPIPAILGRRNFAASRESRGGFQVAFRAIAERKISAKFVRECRRKNSKLKKLLTRDLYHHPLKVPGKAFFEFGTAYRGRPASI
jgi:hypothetical protein